MEVTEGIKELIILYALNKLLDNLNESDLDSIDKFMPIKGLSGEEVRDLILITLEDYNE